MNSGKNVFSQITSHLPLHHFHACVERYRGNSNVHALSCLDQFLCMLFAQLTARESLRDLTINLQAMQPKLYHMGIRATIVRSTLAYANERRSWRIYADFAQVLITQARKLYADEPFALDLKGTVYALDSSTIDLCLTLFPWAHFRKTKSAVKLHTLLDLHGNIPSFIQITDGKVHDVNILDAIVPENGAFYIMDRAYVDFARLFLLNQALAFFVVRAKKNHRHPIGVGII